MNKQITLELLQSLGLEEIEASLYLYLLENGPRTYLELSRETNYDRSKIYRYVDKLEKKNFLEQSMNARGKKLQAANPGNIQLFLEKKEDRLQSQLKTLPGLLKELSSLSSYAQREFEVKHYRGQEGLRQMLWNHLQAKEEIVAFSYKNKNDVVGKPYAEKIRTEQVHRQITLYELENETDQGDYWYTDVKNWGQYYQSCHLSPKVLDIKQYTAIFNNTVSIINWLKNEEVGLEIINAPFAEMQKKLFWKFWELNKKKK